MIHPIPKVLSILFQRFYPFHPSIPSNVHSILFQRPYPSYSKGPIHPIPKFLSIPKSKPSHSKVLCSHPNPKSYPCIPFQCPFHPIPKVHIPSYPQIPSIPQPASCGVCKMSASLLLSPLKFLAQYWDFNNGTLSHSLSLPRLSKASLIILQ